MKFYLLAFFLFVLILIIVKKKDNFNINRCLGRKDGISGCRDCCQNYKNYNQCVYNCMNF